MLDKAAAELQRAQAMAAFEAGRATGVAERPAMTTIEQQDAAMKKAGRDICKCNTTLTIQTPSICSNSLSNRCWVVFLK